jgi:hypothetical protein
MNDWVVLLAAVFLSCSVLWCLARPQVRRPREPQCEVAVFSRKLQTQEWWITGALKRLLHSGPAVAPQVAVTIPPKRSERRRKVATGGGGSRPVRIVIMRFVTQMTLVLDLDETLIHSAPHPDEPVRAQRSLFLSCNGRLTSMPLLSVSQVHEIRWETPATRHAL